MRQRAHLFLLSAILAFGKISCLPLVSAENPWHVRELNGVVTEELRFTNGDAQLVGTVYLPAGGNHLPAVVVLHDASIPSRQAALYRHLSEGLPAMGIAVLIYDRRGTGQSSGSHDNDLATLADDGIAGQHALSKITRIDPNNIGFWGLSQGGWLAVLAAVRSPKAAFAISVSAPLVSPDEQMQFAMTNLMTIRGFSESDIQQMLDTRKAWAGYVRGENSRAIAVAALQKPRPSHGLAWSIFRSPPNFPARNRFLIATTTRTTTRLRQPVRPTCLCFFYMAVTIRGFRSPNPWSVCNRSAMSLITSSMQLSLTPIMK